MVHIPGEAMGGRKPKGSLVRGSLSLSGSSAGSETALCAAASLYSKEVEHSEENQQLLLKLFRRKSLTWQYLVSVLDA